MVQSSYDELAHSWIVGIRKDSSEDDRSQQMVHPLVCRVKRHAGREKASTQKVENTLRDGSMMAEIPSARQVLVELCDVVPIVLERSGNHVEHDDAAFVRHDHVFQCQVA